MSAVVASAFVYAPTLGTGAFAGTVGPVERWSGADQSAGGIVTGDASFQPNAYLKLPSQTLTIVAVKPMTFPANLGFASGNPGQLYRVTSGGTSVLPGGNFLCGGASKSGAQPTYLIVTHYSSKYEHGRRLVEIGVYQNRALPTGTSSDALCNSIGFSVKS